VINEGSHSWSGRALKATETQLQHETRQDKRDLVWRSCKKISTVIESSTCNWILVGSDGSNNILYSTYQTQNDNYIPVSQNMSLHCDSKKHPNQHLLITLAIVGRLLKSIHCWSQQYTCYKTAAIFPTTPVGWLSTRHGHWTSTSQVFQRLHVQRTQSQTGDRSFSVAGPRLWNNLPTEIRRRGTTFEHYRQLLKAFLFAYAVAHCAGCRHSYLLTHSLTLNVLLHYLAKLCKLCYFPLSLMMTWMC